MGTMKDEIEVSEAMIWAAESAVEPADLEISDPDLWVVIYRAMERVRREECGPTAIGWQPIETAPRDGTAILLISKAYEDDYYHPARCSIGKWLAEGTAWVDQYGTAGEAEDVCELAQTGIWSSGGGWFEPNEVTHWMPLPEPPK